MERIGNILDAVRAAFDEGVVSRPDPARPIDIQNAANELDAHFPKSYVEFLQIQNGVAIGDFHIFGLDDLCRATRDNREAALSGWRPSHLQISTGNLGNPYYIDTGRARDDRHPVCFLVRADGRNCIVASDFPHFLWFFTEELRERLERDGTWKQPQPLSARWPVDRAYVLRHDPAIGEWRDLTPSWRFDAAAFGTD